MNRIIVIGGGVTGLSVAWHLARRGGCEVTLLERHQLTSGTSWHAAGIVGPLRATPNMTQLAIYAQPCFELLQQHTGMSTGYRQTGGYWLARRPQRMDELNRIATLGQHFGLHTRVLNRDQLTAQLPFLDLSAHAGGISVAQDGNVNPVDLCMAYARAARDLGVALHEHCEVARICRRGDSVCGVQLADGGLLEADNIALCAGAWSRALAQTAGLELPIQAVEHMYVVTEPMQQLPLPFPVLRDLDSGIYIKGDTAGKVVIGGFEPNAKCWDPSSAAGHQPFIEFADDWQQFEPFMHAALALLPALHQVGIQRFMNGPESFTADTRPLVGLAPGTDGLYVAAGMNSVGVMSSAGVGRVLADWIVDGQAPMDLWEIDVARVDPATASDAHLAERMTEAVADLFAMHWPYKQQRAGRYLRTSALHQRWQAQGAVFGLSGGLERALWFAQNPREQSLPYSVAEQPWQPLAAREAAWLAQRSVLLDLSAFALFDITGADALHYLQRLCCANIDIDIGRVVYTSVLNQGAGIEADVTITRVASDGFRLTSGGATRWRDLALLRRRAAGFEVDILDCSEREITLGVMGAGARATLQSVSADDWQTFAFSSSRPVTVAGVSCQATRLSYIGEPGWELSIAAEQAHRVFDVLIAAGVKPMGQYALASCRIEKGFLHWGHDIGPDITPLEAGSGRIDWHKEFVGKAALLAQKQRGTRRRVCLFEVTGEPLLLHDEPIVSDGKIIGLTSSGTLGVRTGMALAIGLIDTEINQSLASLSRRQYHITVAGQDYSARLLEQPPHDPGNEYIRL